MSTQSKFNQLLNSLSINLFSDNKSFEKKLLSNKKDSSENGSKYNNCKFLHNKEICGIIREVSKCSMDIYPRNEKYDYDHMYRSQMVPLLNSSNINNDNEDNEFNPKVPQGEKLLVKKPTAKPKPKNDFVAPTINVGLTGVDGGSVVEKGVKIVSGEQVVESVEVTGGGAGGGKSKKLISSSKKKSMRKKSTKVLEGEGKLEIDGGSKSVPTVPIVPIVSAAGVNSEETGGRLIPPGGGLKSIGNSPKISKVSFSGLAEDSSGAGGLNVSGMASEMSSQDSKPQSELMTSIRKSVFSIEPFSRPKGRRTVIVDEPQMRQRKSTIMLLPEDRIDLQIKQMSGARRQSMVQLRQGASGKKSVFGERKSRLTIAPSARKSVAFNQNSIFSNRKSRIGTRQSVLIRERVTQANVQTKKDISDLRKKTVFNNRERSTMGRMRMADINLLSSIDTDNFDDLNEMTKATLLDKMSKVAKMTSEFQTDLEDEEFYAINDSYDSFKSYGNDSASGQYEPYAIRMNTRKSTMNKKYYHDVDEDNLCLAMSDIQYLTRHSNIVGSHVMFKFSAGDIGDATHELNLNLIPHLNRIGLHYLPLRALTRIVLIAFNNKETAMNVFNWYKTNLLDKRRDILHLLHVHQPREYSHRRYQLHKLSKIKLENFERRTKESKTLAIELTERCQALGLDTEYRINITDNIAEEIINTRITVEGDMIVVCLTKKKNAFTLRSLPRTGRFLVKNAGCPVYVVAPELRQHCFAK